MNKGAQNYGFNLKRRGITTEKRTSKKVSPTTTPNHSIKRIPVFDLRYRNSAYRFGKTLPNFRKSFFGKNILNSELMINVVLLFLIFLVHKIANTSLQSRKCPLFLRMLSVYWLPTAQEFDLSE